MKRGAGDVIGALTLGMMVPLVCCGGLLIKAPLLDQYSFDI